MFVRKVVVAKNGLCEPQMFCWWPELRVGVGGTEHIFLLARNNCRRGENWVRARGLGFCWSGNGLVWPPLDVGSPKCISVGQELVSGGQNSGPWFNFSFSQKNEVFWPGWDSHFFTLLGQKHRVARGGFWKPKLYPGLPGNWCPWQENHSLKS
jgi:hypothetical protein